jgi:6-pyruvoyltetrahydropterin/6-carboxytetrahydropterin synthase
MLYTATRIERFSAGHRLLGHEGHCAYLHGHNYRAEIYARAAKVDEVGRVIDFSVLKEVIGAWIQQHLDHSFLVYAEDHDAIAALRMVRGQPIFTMSANPTAENIAALILDRANTLLGKYERIEVFKVLLWETDNCFATAELPHSIQIATMREVLANAKEPEGV